MACVSLCSGDTWSLPLRIWGNFTGTRAVPPVLKYKGWTWVHWTWADILGFIELPYFGSWTVSADIFGWTYLYLYLYLNRCICICICIWIKILSPYWHHQMETFSALLVLWAGNSLLTCEILSQRSVTRTFDVFFDLRPNKRLGKQS